MHQPFARLLAVGIPQGSGPGGLIFTRLKGAICSILFHRIPARVQRLLLPGPSVLLRLLLGLLVGLILLATAAHSADCGSDRRARAGVPGNGSDGGADGRIRWP